MNLLHSFQSEWMKTRRSAAGYLSLLGGFFIPLILLIGYFYRHKTLNSMGPLMWQAHYQDAWQAMEGFLLPMGMIMATSLITQVEFRNNTWKQLHTTPQSYVSIFTAKLGVIVGMTLKFFLFFNLGAFLSALLPSLMLDGKLPEAPFPLEEVLRQNGNYFITCLPIIGFQYLVSLQSRNFLVPIGAGLFAYIGTVLAMSWKYVFLSPFSFCIAGMIGRPLDSSHFYWAIGEFVLLVILGFVLYLTRSEKG